MLPVEAVIKEIQPAASLREENWYWIKDYLEQGSVNLPGLILVISEGDSWTMGLKPLMGANFALKCSDLGLIYSFSLFPVDIVTATDGKRRIIVSDGARQQLFYPRPDKVKDDYLENIPGHKSTALRYNPIECGTIEEAIEVQSNLLAGAITGAENSDLVSAYTVINQLDQCAGAVFSQPINERGLSSLVEMTGSYLTQYGILSAFEAKERGVLGAIIQSFKKDIQNIINPLLRRVKLEAIYLRAVKELINVSRIAEKNTVNLAQLNMEREINRWALQMAVKFLGEELWQQIPYIQKQILAEISHGLLTVPRVNPYLLIARWAAIALKGCRPQHVNMNRLIIQERWDSLRDSLSVVQMLENNDSAAAQRRVQEIQQVLIQTLAENELVR